MVNQQVFLPMVPDSAPIIVNISQYDFDAAGYAGRLFFNLVYQGTAYDMDGASAVFQGEKPDGTTFAYPATVVNNSVVRVNVRQQMTAVSGRVVCSLVLNNNDGQIGSFNIWLEVQPSSTSGGDPSQTDIPALIAQAKQYADVAEQAATDVAAYSENPPYIGANGNWFVWDATNEEFIDTGVYAAGSEGNAWYSGTAISGKDPTPTVFPSSGITSARQGDMYLNKTEGAIYQCTLAGAASVAKWSYQMTLTGGGSGGVTDYPDLNNLPQINSNTLIGNKTGADLGLQDALTAGNGISLSQLGVIAAKLSAGSNVALTPKSDGSIEISASGGGQGSSTLGGLSDVSLTTPVDGQILVYNGNDSEWENTENIKDLAKFGGSKTFSQLTSSLLVAANEDKFYLCTDGGTISAADAANWVLPQGAVIPANSHIAVINTGTAQNPVYKFDDFGGYIDLSGLAEKTELDGWTAAQTISTSDTSKTFTGLNTSYAYKPFIQVADGEDALPYNTIVFSGTSCTVTFDSPSAAQAAGNACQIKLRIIK